MLWSRRPSAAEIAELSSGQVSGHVEHVILAQQDPEALLADARTACFAMSCASADPTTLATRVVAALLGAPPRAAVVAALAAAAAGP